VIVGVVLAATFRPAARQAASAGLAANEAAQREVRVRSLSRRRPRDSSRQHGLHLVEEVLGDQRLEVTALVSNTVLRYVDNACIELVAQQDADRLRREWLPSPVGESRLRSTPK
jgi:hypothetical protein